MKVLHTADWHLGHRLHEQSQVEEQLLFLDWLEDYIKTKAIDVLLVSGDVFDSGSPSNQSLHMYYNFLMKLQKTNCKSVIITGGNHDSPGTLNAPKDLLKALSIHVVGKASEHIEDEVFELNINNENVIIGAVPFLRDGDIRRATAGETFEELTDKYKTALIQHYDRVATHCNKINTTKAPVIAMGHLFAMGGSVSDSEQNIYVGTLGHIGAADFPSDFDYVALGHLHRPQIVGGNEKVRYSGSPNVLSFSEINYDKKVILLTLEQNKIASITDDIIPNFRNIQRISGTLQDCMSQFPNIRSNDFNLTPWIEIVLDEQHTINTDELKKEAENYTFEILKISLKKQRKIKGIEELLANSK